MLKFDDVASYLKAIENNPSIAGVPIPLVADHLDITPAAVTGMINTGRLEALRISRSTFVSAKSLIEYQGARERDVNIVERYLWSLASSGTLAVFYEPVMATIGLTPAVPAHRKRIGEILGTISEKSFDEHGVMLSVLVHRKSAGQTKPGVGFFELAKGMGLDTSDEEALVSAETKKALRVARKLAH